MSSRDVIGPGAPTGGTNVERASPLTGGDLATLTQPSSADGITPTTPTTTTVGGKVAVDVNMAGGTASYAPAADVALSATLTAAWNGSGSATAGSVLATATLSAVGTVGFQLHSASWGTSQVQPEATVDGTNWLAAAVQIVRAGAVVSDGGGPLVSDCTGTFAAAGYAGFRLRMSAHQASHDIAAALRVSAVPPNEGSARDTTTASVQSAVQSLGLQLPATLAANGLATNPAGVPLILNAGALLLMVGTSANGTTTSGAATLSWGTGGSNPGAGILAVSGLTCLAGLQIENLTGSSRAVKVFVGTASPVNSQTAIFDGNVGNNSTSTPVSLSSQGIAMSGLSLYILIDSAVGPFTGTAISNVNVNTPLSIMMLGY